LVSPARNPVPQGSAGFCRFRKTGSASAWAQTVLPCTNTTPTLITVTGHPGTVYHLNAARAPMAACCATGPGYATPLVSAAGQWACVVWEKVLVGLILIRCADARGLGWDWRCSPCGVVCHHLPAGHAHTPTRQHTRAPLSRRTRSTTARASASSTYPASCRTPAGPTTWPRWTWTRPARPTARCVRWEVAGGVAQSRGGSVG
jgi:hypothetical protein